MTIYEWFRWFTFPIMTAHLRTVHSDIKKLVLQSKATNVECMVLDVGGRKSPYTIGVLASITLLDVPQETGVKEELNLGFTADILATIQKKRSNIDDLIIMDMTQSSLEANSYDAVVSIEVIEHVEADDLFVKHIAKVIKPNGWAYFTTPNGDYIKNEGPDKNPDHVRHYTRTELQLLLEQYFKHVEVYYAVKTGKYRVQGLRGYSMKRPFKTLQSIFSNMVNYQQSKGLEDTSEKTAHLVAVAYK